MPLASAPAQIAGRNRMWRKMMIDDLKRNDVAAAVQILLLVGSAPLQWHEATHGHSTHTWAAVWERELRDFLATNAP